MNRSSSSRRRNRKYHDISMPWKLIKIEVDLQKKKKSKYYMSYDFVSFIYAAHEIFLRSVFPVYRTCCYTSMPTRSIHQLLAGPPPWSTSNSIKMNFVNGDDRKDGTYLFRSVVTTRQRHESFPPSVSYQFFQTPRGADTDFRPRIDSSFIIRALL